MNAVGQPAQPDGLLRLDGVGKRYGTQIALAEISLTVERHHFLVLLGPSGSGKTTMLRSIAGIERITSGTISLDGQVVDDGRRLVAPDRRDLAMVFQDYALWPHMTARQNVAYALRRRRLAAADVERRTRDMLARVGLGALGER
ncbi:MAG TPA: ATP-binding cassette domain-containing protein, partial [Chloroflexota bacterium]